VFESDERACIYEKIHTIEITIKIWLS
jgi:hypothetical protein